MKYLKLSGKNDQDQSESGYQLENGVEGIIFHMVNSTATKESLEKKH